MSQLQGFTPYERNHIDSNGDYVKESIWTHSDTVEAPDGDLLSNKLSRGVYLSDEVETEQTEIIPLSIDDNGVSTTSAWSSNKVKSVTDSLGTLISNFTEIDDSATAQNSTWSSSKIAELVTNNSLFCTTLQPDGILNPRIGTAAIFIGAREGITGSPDIVVIDSHGGVSRLGSTAIMLPIVVEQTSGWKLAVQNTQSSEITVIGIVFRN